MSPSQNIAAAAVPAHAHVPVTDPAALERQIGQMITGTWVTRALAEVATLGIADRLAEGPCTAAELAPRIGAHGPSLHRVLRALASIGIFTQDEADRFGLAPLGALLVSEAPGSKRSLAIMVAAELQQAWDGLSHALRTGTTPFDAVFGAPFFRYLDQHPDRWRLYDEAMNSVHGAETIPVLDAYDLSGVRTLVDVGGGCGRALATALRQHPDLHGVLYDLPDVADRARAMLAASDVAPRCESIGGDFFASVPAGADAYFLRHVIHDWDDETAAQILRRCAQAMAPGGRILVVESVIPPGDAPSFGKWLDLMMLVVGGRERTLAEFTRVFAAAGLRLARVVPTAHEVSILEGLALD